MIIKSNYYSAENNRHLVLLGIHEIFLTKMLYKVKIPLKNNLLYGILLQSVTTMKSI